jgi:large subunit ribosomal protein L30
MAILVVRLRGTVNVPYWAVSTLKNLCLNKRFSATLVPETPEYLGMLRKISQWVAWSKADREIVKTLIENRAKNKNPGSDSGRKTVNSKEVYKDIDELVDFLVNDKIKFSEQNNVKPWFSLNPPKGGFKKSTKRQFSDGGTLGNNKDLLEIVKKMI